MPTSNQRNGFVIAESFHSLHSGTLPTNLSPPSLFALNPDKTGLRSTFEVVHPTGIEPVSTVPETAVLSVELRVRV